MQYCEKKAWSRFLNRAMLFIACFMFIFGAGRAEAASFADRSGDMTEITGIRVGEEDSGKVRVVVDSADEVDYDVSVLSSPQRIVVDFNNAWIDSDLKGALPLDLNSRAVTGVRVAQYDESTVRVVIESPVGKGEYSVFALNSPERIVMDFGISGSSYSASSSSSSSSGRGINFDYQPGSHDDDDEDEEDDDNWYSSRDEDEEEEDEDDSDYTPNLSGGLEGKVIALDAGHGGADVGAIGPTGVTEKSITLRVAKELQKRLTAEGATVLMTRTTDTEVAAAGAYASDIEELQARCDVGNDNNADIFISLHMDSFTTSTPAGTTGYYYVQGSEASKRLARLLSQGIVNAAGTANRGIKTCNFYVVKNTDMPATLVEMAFISNEREEAILNSDSGVKNVVTGLMNGIRSFFN